MQTLFSKKPTNWFKANFWDLVFGSLLFFTVVFIVYKNYSSETWLTGWDNLHPEFNFKLNIERSLNTVWQEYQGLGLLGGMAHASDFPRQLILWGLSVFIPAILLRWLWTFSMLFLGPLGIYFLAGKKFPGFVASVFYLLNLATVQFFFTSFDSFTTFYGFLSWLIFLSIQFLKEGEKKDLLILFAVLALATPSFYVQTFFVVFAVFLLFIGFEVAIRQGWMGIKRFFVLGVIVFVVNSFWLLPVGYFTLKRTKDLSISHQNSIATPETRYFNLNRGNFENISTLKGFWFDYRDYQNGTFESVIDENAWKATSYFFWLSFAGLLVGIFTKRNSLRFSLPALFGISYLMLVGYYLRLNLPIVNEMFRSVFTKWSIPFVLLMSLGLSRLVVGKYAKAAVAVVLVSLVVFYTKPVFDGKLVYREIKQEIPREYFELFKFFNSRPAEARILRLPIPTFWGWDFHSWGYRGSGFLWYGIRQPILHRSFDVWSSHNETFYNEAAYALYAKDFNAFERVLRKHQVKYLLLDESVINAGGGSEILFIPEIKEMLAGLGYQEAAKFGFLTVYETPFGVEKFISAPETYTAVNTDLTYSQTDPVYAKDGDYFQLEEGVGYPFVNFDRRGPVEIRLQPSPGGEQLIFENKRAKAEVVLPVKEKISETFGADRGFDQAYNCDLLKKGNVVRKSLGEGRAYLARDGGVACDFYVYENLKASQAYVLRIKGKNLQGRSLKIYFQNWQTYRMDLEELLPAGEFDNYFVVQGGPHTLNLETRSFGRIAAENEVEKIEFIPFDRDFLTGLVQNSEKQTTSQNNLQIEKIKKIGTAFYQVETSGEGLLMLGQGYEDGWIAFSVTSQKPFRILAPGVKIARLQHLKVNSWANGWVVQASTISHQPAVIYIVFWPQLLEWGGMALGLVTFIYLLTRFRQRLYYT